MRLVSPLLKNLVYPGLSRSGCLRLLSNAQPVVVTYHGILPAGYRMRHPVLDGHLVTAEAFRVQVELLRSKYHLISAAEFLAWSEGNLDLPPRSVMLTCDDGLLNAFTEMLPVIRELKLPFMFFVTAASTLETRSMLWHEKLFLWLVERGKFKIKEPQSEKEYAAANSQQSVWVCHALIEDLSRCNAEEREHSLDEIRIQLGISESWQSSYSQSGPLGRRFLMMNADELREIASSGVAVGAHTISHPMLSKMSEESAYAEILHSRLQIETLLGEPVWALAYPFGGGEAVGVRETRLAERAGFKCAFRNTERHANGSDFAFPRVHVTFEMGPCELDAHVSGLHHALRNLRPGAALAG